VGIEIERKFLIDPGKLPELPRPIVVRQGYIPAENATVRARTMNDKGFLTLKGRTRGFTRSEFEYEIPFEDASAILEELCTPPLIEKRRYRLYYENHIWEIDIFEGENEGLCMAEVELRSEDEEVVLPPWVTKEVTGDRRYYNASLRTHPYRSFA